MKDRRQDLRREVNGILRSLGHDYEVEGVLWESDRLRWVLQIRTPRSHVSVEVPFELADDALDSAAFHDIERLRNLVLFGIGRGELIGKLTA